VCVKGRPKSLLGGWEAAEEEMRKLDWEEVAKASSQTLSSFMSFIEPLHTQGFSFGCFFLLVYLTR